MWKRSLAICYGATLMRECPQCNNLYPETYKYCPADGISLVGEDQRRQESSDSAKKPAQIRVRTLMLGIAILFLSAAVSFTGFFLYQYYKPKYGSLTVKTSPAGAMIYVDGKLRGVSPITLSDLHSGSHDIKGTKQGYKELAQRIDILANSTQNMHWSLDPIVPQLSNEQLAEVETWRKKLDSALKENILLPPPDDYNALFFADKILAIDPANNYALDTKNKMADTTRRLAELAYAREDWLESEKQYKNLSLLFPNDIAIGERLSDVTAKLDASVKDREKQIQDWKSKAEAAMKMGSLLPPDRDNALDAIRSIQRLDRDNLYVREGFARLKELLQNRGDTRIAASDWPGARNEFRVTLQYFPEDTYSKARLAVVEAKLVEAARDEQLRIQRTAEEQQSRQKLSSLRLSALNNFRSGAYDKAISEWQEYLKFEPGSDEAYFYLGASQQNQKQLDTAILNFEKCLSLNPNNVLAHLNLGMLYDYHRNNFKLAEEHLKKAKDLGGAEKYSQDRLQSMIQDVKDRAQASTVLRTLFPVEHKHAFSTCRGTLRFTDEGLEFKTSETDHSFYEAFKGLRIFAIEGSDISIKTRSNKKYNFHLINAGDAARLRTWNASLRTVELSGQTE
jgi:tetratricopeptide (TPR) repeat protein